MYFVKYGNEYLHDPRVDGYMLLDISLDGEENSCGYCDFTIYPDHPLYDKLKERDSANPIEVYDNDDLLFAGFIYELGKEFYLEGHVKCKGELDYLNESIIRPYATFERGFGTKVADNLPGYFEWLIEQHNEQVKDQSKQFTIGVNEISKFYDGESLDISNDDYPTTFEEITNMLIGDDAYGGYLRVRHENGIRYIDYLYEWTDKNTQVMNFGVNLTDYSQTDNSEKLATFVVPTGARMRDTEYEYNDGYSKTSDTSVDSYKTYYTQNKSYEQAELPTTESQTILGHYSHQTSTFDPDTTYYEYDDETGKFSVTEDSKPNRWKRYYTVTISYSPVNNLSAFESGVDYYEYDEYKDESDVLLTISDMTDMAYVEDDYKKLGDLIYSQSAVNKYGWIGYRYANTEITTKEDLTTIGVYVLMNLISPIRTIEIKAVDMHLINPDLKPIRIGEYVRVRSVPHNLDSHFLCRSISLDLNSPENSTYIFGTTYDTLTGQQNEIINRLNESVNLQLEVASKLTDTEKQTAMSLAAIESNFEDRIDEVIQSNTNLLLGTRDFTGNQWNNFEYWETWDKGTFDYTEYGRWGAWMGIYQPVEVRKDVTYTFSFTALGDSNARIHVYLSPSNTEGNVVDTDDIYIGSVTNEHARYEATFTAIANGYIYPRVENEVEESWLQICALKLEVGSSATEWSPAPDDILEEQDAAITSLYEDSLTYQSSTDDAICALYELMNGDD